MMTDKIIRRTASKAARQSPDVERNAETTGGVVHGTKTTVLEIRPNEVAT